MKKTTSMLLTALAFAPCAQAQLVCISEDLSRGGSLIYNFRVTIDMTKSTTASATVTVQQMTTGTYDRDQPTWDFVSNETAPVYGEVATGLDVRFGSGFLRTEAVNRKARYIKGSLTLKAWGQTPVSCSQL